MADFIAYSVIGEVVVGKNRVLAAREIADRVGDKVPIAVMGVGGAPLELTIISRVARPDQMCPSGIRVKTEKIDAHRWPSPAIPAIATRSPCQWHFPLDTDIYHTIYIFT
jgi:hypothetical protein